MKPTISFMREYFDRFNKEYFQGELPEPIFDLMSRKSVLGDYTFKPFPEIHRIRLNKIYDRDKKDLENTLIHEMIHFYIKWNNIVDTKSHGVYFKRFAKLIKQKSNGYYNIEEVSPINLTSIYGKCNSTMVIFYFPKENGLSVISQNNIMNFIIPLVAKRYKFEIYFTNFAYFKRYKRCQTRLTMYNINSNEKEVMSLLEQSKNVTNMYIKR